MIYKKTLIDRLPRVHGDWHEFESKIRRHESKKGTVAVAPRAPSPQPSSLSSLQAPISEKHPNDSISPSKRVDSLAAKSASYEFMDTSQPDMTLQKSPLEGRGRMVNMDADSIKRRSESLDQDQLRKKQRLERNKKLKVLAAAKGNLFLLIQKYPNLRAVLPRAKAADWSRNLNWSSHLRNQLSRILIRPRLLQNQYRK